MINILWLYGSIPKFDVINHWYHADFAKVLSKMPNINLMLYGFGMEKLYPNMTKTPYDAKMTGKDIKKEFNFDVIIMDNKQRFLDRAQPSINPRTFWLTPSFFNGLGETPKIMLEGDYHQHVMRANLSSPELDWYVDRQVDLLLVRHLDNLKHAKNSSIPMMWLPCSVNNTIFKPNLEIERINKICLISGYGLATYKYRTLAGKILSSTDLVDIYQKRFIGEDYITCLQQYMSHISGSSGSCRNYITAAKMFEIMASGSLLLTDKGDEYGLKELFPGSSYCTYKRDGSDIITKSELIINEPAYRKFVTNRAIECISKKHTHEIRANELLDIIVKKFGISYGSPLKLKAGFFSIMQKIFFKDTNKIKEEKIIVKESPHNKKIEDVPKIKESTPNKEIIAGKNERKLKELCKKGIKVYLLKDTCYSVLINNTIGDILNIAVSNKRLAKEILGDNFNFHPIPKDTRKYKYNDMIVYIPYKIMYYLKSLYGKDIVAEFKKKKKRLRLIYDFYKFLKRD